MKMPSIKSLFEDAFADQVQQAYAEDLENKTQLSPENFSPDSIQLGVVYESAFCESFAEALLTTMENLEENPHYYDDVIDIGERKSDTRANPITWTGSPVVQRL